MNKTRTYIYIKMAYSTIKTRNRYISSIAVVNEMSHQQQHCERPNIIPALISHEIIPLTVGHQVKVTHHVHFTYNLQTLLQALCWALLLLRLDVQALVEDLLFDIHVQ